MLSCIGASSRSKSSGGYSCTFTEPEKKNRQKIRWWILDPKNVLTILRNGEIFGFRKRQPDFSPFGIVT